MATCTINLYYETPMNPNRNYAIEDIDSFLTANAAGKLEIENFQFLDLKPSLKIKINMAQYNLQWDADFDINYCHIARIGTGFDDSGAFYFVINKRWVSQSTIELELQMDVLNTFEWNSDYLPLAKTLVAREHKDRFSSKIPTKFKFTGHAEDNGLQLVSDSTMYIGFDWMADEVPVKILTNTSADSGDPLEFQFELIDFESILYFYLEGRTGLWRIADGGGDEWDIGCEKLDVLKFDLLRNIDLESENIIAPKYKKSENDIEDKVNTSWLLHYINKNEIDPDAYNEVNPVECRLLNKDPITISYSVDSGSITNVVIGDGNVFFFTSYNVGNGAKIDVDGRKLSISNDAFTYNFVAIFAQAGSLTIRYMTISRSVFNPNYYRYSHDETINNPSVVKLENAPATINVWKETRNDMPNATYVIVNIYGGVSNYSFVSGTEQTKGIIGSGTIDRTLAKNIKIIELPYSPTPLVVDNQGNVSVSEMWTFTNNEYFLLNNDNVAFENLFDSSVDNPFDSLLVHGMTSLNVSASKNMAFESKLYHSDYFTYKFVYDSFSLTFFEELMATSPSYLHNFYDDKFKVKFVTSRNIVSKFSFIIPQYELNLSMSDYDNVINVSRNNEQVLYSSQYINYLRTGYNYDLKSKERTDLTGAVGIGLSALGTGVGLAIGVATQNPLVLAGSVVAGAVSLASQTISYAKNVAESEQNIARKLQESKNQAVSVQNADDIDLLNAYSNNRAKLCLYEVSYKMRNALFDLFYYYGYSTNEHKIPNIESRYWFNYLECNLIIDGWSQNMSKEIKDMIIEKFKNGVTFFHKHSGTWDFDQVKENWETSLMED